MNNKKMKLYELIREFSPLSVLILKIGLLPVAMQAAILLICADRMADIDPIYAQVHYLPGIEYVMMSLTLVVGGALLFDLLERYYKKER